MTTKRWVLYVALGIALAVLTVMCVAGGDSAQAATTATQSEPGDSTSFTLSAQPTTLQPLNGGQCWEWGGSWENKDGFGRLRFGYGWDDIACTNSAATKWTQMPKFDRYHWVGYWHHKSTKKSHSSLGYSFLDTTATWEFTWDAPGVELLHKDRTLRCRLDAPSHTAYCTLYYN